MDTKRWQGISLTYQASPDEYSKNLATFEKMADSLEIR